MRTSDILIADFFNPKILLDKYKFSPSGMYFSLTPDPDAPHKTYMDYIEVCQYRIYDLLSLSPTDSVNDSFFITLSPSLFLCLTVSLFHSLPAPQSHTLPPSLLLTPSHTPAHPPYLSPALFPTSLPLYFLPLSHSISITLSHYH